MIKASRQGTTQTALRTWEWIAYLLIDLGDPAMNPHLNTFRYEQGGFRVEALCQLMGADYLVSIWGGVAHIGAVAMAHPRASLDDPGKKSATASVFCYLGHKEDQLAKEVSERLSTALDAKVVVAAGLHWDHLSPSGIDQVVANVRALTAQIVATVKPESPDRKWGAYPQPSSRAPCTDEEETS